MGLFDCSRYAKNLSVKEHKKPHFKMVAATKNYYSDACVVAWCAAERGEIEDDVELSQEGSAQLIYLQY